MSAYAEVATEFTDGDLLIKALEEHGYKPLNCIGNPQPLVGYMGDYRTLDGNGHTKDANLALKADIVIPRAQVGGSSNDLGFKRNPNGTYSAVISDFDSRRHSQQWLNKVAVSYQVGKTEQDARRAGVRQVGRKTLPNGDIQLIYVKA